MACARVADGSQAGGGRASQFQVASLGRGRGSRCRPLARWGRAQSRWGVEVAAEQHQQDGKDEYEEEASALCNHKTQTRGTAVCEINAHLRYR